MAGESQYVSRIEFARIRGCAASYVTKLGHQGRLVLDASGKLVDVAATIALLDRTDDPARGGDRTGKPTVAASAPTSASQAEGHGTAPPNARSAADGDSAPIAISIEGAYRTAATRERIAKARLAELDLAEKAGTLVPKAEVEAAIFGLARQAMDALDAIPDRLAAQLAALDDAAAVHKLLSDELRHVMQALAAAKPEPAEPAKEAA